MTNEFDIIIHPLVKLWLANYAKTDPLALDFLTQGNKDYFTKIMGKPQGNAMKYDYWVQQYSGFTIYVYSNEQSTIYKVNFLGEKEAFINDNRIGSYIIGFLEKFIKMMKGC